MRTRKNFLVLLYLIRLMPYHKRLCGIFKKSANDSHSVKYFKITSMSLQIKIGQPIFWVVLSGLHLYI